MQKEILYSMGDYELVIGKLEDESRGYKLLNKVTKVVEVETKILPQAFKYLEDLSAGLDAARDSLNSEKEELNEG